MKIRELLRVKSARQIASFWFCTDAPFCPFGTLSRFYGNSFDALVNQLVRPYFP